MVTIEQLKKLLNKKGKDLSDKELGGMLKLQYQLANAFFDSWQKKDKVISVSSTVVVNRKNGKCISVYTFGFLYAR